jgi:hypothetical protein
LSRIFCAGMFCSRLFVFRNVLVGIFCWECFVGKILTWNLEHMLISCQRSLAVWGDVIHRSEMLENVSVHWTVSHFLFGFFHDNYTNEVRKRFNTIVLLAKYYIYTQRRVESFTFSAIQFQFALKRYLLSQWHVAQYFGEICTFEQLWNGYI